MPVEISILSGSRQGDSMQLPDGPLEIGSQPGNTIYFDPQADPSIVGHQASIWRGPDGWQVRSSGSRAIAVNHDDVTGIRTLRSGDIIRMSDDGPDLSFVLIGRVSPQRETPLTTTGIVSTHEPLPISPTVEKEVDQPDVTREADDATKTVDKRWWVIGGGVGALLLLGIVVLTVAWNVAHSDSATSGNGARMRLGPIEALAIDEGQTLIWRPTILDPGPLGTETHFKLGADVPSGMDIDAETGTLRWTPTEAQGPQDVKVPLIVETSHAGITNTQNETLFIVVREVNQAPRIEAPPRQKVNLLTDSALALRIVATDPDIPKQELSFALVDGFPDGMTIDRRSGEVNWRAAQRHANQEFSVTIRVSDNSDLPSTAETTLSIKVVSPDPLDYAAERVSESVYLVGAQPAGLGTFYPLGTACAVSEHLLVTNAAVATGVAKAEQVNWNVVVVRATLIDQRHERSIPIQQALVHQAYVAAGDPTVSVFFDLGLLRVDEPLPATCSLATPRDLAALSINQTIGCFGFTLEEAALTRFDNPVPALHRVKLSRILFPDDDVNGPFRLMELAGEVPQLAYGSLIINSAGMLLGVYAMPGELPADDASGRQVHYAPVATLVSLRLGDRDMEKHWIAPPIPTTDKSATAD